LPPPRKADAVSRKIGEGSLEGIKATVIVKLQIFQNLYDAPALLLFSCFLLSPAILALALPCGSLILPVEEGFTVP
jgi:hypothetical protein